MAPGPAKDEDEEVKDGGMSLGGDVTEPKAVSSITCEGE
jgi:hypothetical protein